MNRRKFLAFLAAGGVVTAAGLWLPGQKLISIPRTPKGVIVEGNDKIMCLSYYDKRLTNAELDVLSGRVTGSGIEDAGNGWYRHWMTFSEHPHINFGDPGLEVWGARIETGPVSSVYVKT